MYTYTHAHTHTHTYTHAHTHTHVYTRTHTYTYTHVHTHVHTCTYTHVYTYTHAHARTHTRTHTHTYTHTYTHVHTHIHTHTPCTEPSSAVSMWSECFVVGVLMFCKFLSRLVGEERCHADSCSDFTFPSMCSGGSLMDTKIYVHAHTHTQRRAVTGRIIEGCPLSCFTLEPRKSNCHINEQLPKKRSALSSSLFFFSLFLHLSFPTSFLKSRF